MSTEDQLQRARELIKSKRYDDARKLLWKIDHPKAKQWLERIEGIGPATVVPAAPVKKRRYTWRRMLGLILFIPVSFALVVGGLFLADKVINGEANDARGRLLGYCLDVYMEVSQKSGVKECFGWYMPEFDRQREKVIACHQQSPVLDEPFQECLISEDIIPTGFFLR
jgi:hypothetical protein